MTTLVTGATGFLGSELARQLAADGERVRVLVRETSDRRRLEGADVEVAIGDVTDRGSVAAALEGVSVVHHAAALYEIGTQQADRMRRVNVDGTRNVLEEAAQRGITAVYVSSVAALGPTGKEPVGEEHWAPTPAPSVYGETKREAHLVFRELAAAGAPVRAALPTTIYGPDDDSIFGRLTAFVASGFAVVGTAPPNVASYVHVADCAAGLRAIAAKGGDGEEYLLTVDVHPMRDWFDLACDAAGRRRPLVYLPFAAVRVAAQLARPIAPFVRVPRELVDEGMSMAGDTDYAFTGEKAMRELGWRGRTLQEGLVDTMAWYRGERR